MMKATKGLCALLLDNTRCSSSHNSNSGVEQQSDAAAANVSANAHQPLKHCDANISKHHDQQPQSQHATCSSTALRDSIGPSAVLDKVLDAAMLHSCLPALESWLDGPTPPVAGLLISNRLVQLFQVALEQHAWKVIQLLCDLPAPADVPVAFVERMLLSAVQHRCSTTVKKLCEMPAVAQIKLQAAVQLMQQTQYSDCQSVVKLLLQRIPAVLDMAADDLFALMAMDLQLGQGSNVMHYVSVPAVQEFNAAQARELLKAAITSAHWSLVEFLCSRVPAAKAIDAAEVEALLRHYILHNARSSNANSRQPRVIKGKNDTAVAALLQLPGFAQLSSAAVKTLHAVAVSHRCAVVLSQLPS